tara:strand:+ start:17 stop:436 length:420 start_codon:yes stop_codon:yes gene_type:complete
MSVHRIGDEPNGVCEFASIDLENITAEIECSAHNSNQFSIGFNVRLLSSEIPFEAVCIGCGVYRGLDVPSLIGSGVGGWFLAFSTYMAPITSFKAEPDHPSGVVNSLQKDSPLCKEDRTLEGALIEPVETIPVELILLL